MELYIHPLEFIRIVQTVAAAIDGEIDEDSVFYHSYSSIMSYLIAKNGLISRSIEAPIELLKICHSLAEVTKDNSFFHVTAPSKPLIA